MDKIKKVSSVSQLIRGTFLSKFIHEYNFFAYDSNEALHVSARERQIVNR